MAYETSRQEYAEIHGPTVGDRVRLADTDLFLEVEKDYTTYGEEVSFGGGKVIRAGMGQMANEPYGDTIPDLVIVNVIVVDATGIYKADIGIRDGKIMGIGKAGNPDTQDNVTIPVGVATEAISGNHLILTAGAVDTHIHNISVDQVRTAIDNGTTTFVGGGTGPADGTNATTITPGPGNIEFMIQATQDLPINIGFFGKGHAASQQPLREQIEAGAVGLKIHEDWGSTADAIDQALRCADDMDVQIAIHTDTLNEGGFIDNTIKAIDGRVIHTFHTEGAGGGHAPDILKVAGLPNVLPASTNPTLPYTRNTMEEHLDMIMVCHHLNPNLPEDVAFADSRIRKETIASEDVLHDMGIMSITSSDSQAMGRVGEVALRTWQMAHRMKQQRGPLEGDSENSDNNRIKRYIAKYTINAAIAQGMGHLIGSVEVGKMADLVLWEPAMFGVKPKLVIKGGHINRSIMGDSNASIPTPQPRTMRDAFGAIGSAVRNDSVTFVSQAAMDNNISEKLGLTRRVEPVKDIRKLTKNDMVLNNVMPEIKVDPETYELSIDGEVVTSEPADVLPMAQRYFLF